MVVKWKVLVLGLCTIGLVGCASKMQEVGVIDTTPIPAGTFIAGDGLRIYLPLDTASFLNGIYPIDDRGNVMLPIIGQFTVITMSPMEFAGFLRKTYEQYIRFPELQVTPLIRVSLLGGFRQPGMYYVEPERSMWDLISLAGGTTHEKGLKKAVWERDRKLMRKDLIPYVESGESVRVIGFRSGDQIWTPTENRSFREVFVREILPIATFALSLYVGIMTIRNDN